MQEKLATAQEELSKQRSLLEEATSDLSEKTLALSKTEEAYKEKQNELEQLKENLVGKDLTGIYRVELSPSLTRWSLRPGRPEIVITSEDSEEFKQLTSEQQSLYRQRKQETDALYKKAAIIFGDKRMGQVDGSIQVAPESDKDRLVDIHNMSFEDYVEINELGARILNDLRYQTSQNAGESDTFAPSIITTGSIEISKNIVEAYSNLPKHPRGHVLSILDKFGGPSIVENYYSAGRYSVQGQGEKKSIYSMYHLKQALITSITNSTLNDAHYYDGHAKLNMDYKSGTVGFGFSITVGGVLQVHTFSRIAIGPYGTKEENDSDKYNYTNERYLNSLIPRAQANQEKIDDLREVLEKAKSELLELQNKLANSQQIVQEKQLTVELASQKVEELATRTDTVAMARQELESQENLLKDSKSSILTLSNDLERLRSDLIEKESLQEQAQVKYHQLEEQVSNGKVKLQSLLVQAQAALTVAQTASDAAKAELTKASADYATALEAKTAAEKTLADATATPLQTQVAENNLRLAEIALQNAEARKADAQKAVDNFSANLADKKAALDTAKADLATAQATATAKATVLETAKAELAKQQGTLDSLNKDKAALLAEKDRLVEEAKALAEELDGYLNAPTRLAEAQATLTEKQTALVDAQAKAETVQEKLETVTAKLAEEQAKLAELQAEYDRLKDLEDKAKDNVIATLPDGTIIAVPKDAPTAAEKPAVDVDAIKQTLDKGQDVKVVDGKVVVANPQAGVTVTPQGITYSRVDRAKTLPNTGEQTSLLALAGVAVLSSLGLASARRRKQG
ncbi:TPA: SEC10/PgrA surface exclusion domain-containing protein [Streptococcus suis]|nr:SEC10/PgrA surface exclusion domain-containing protein [Streptococcus suis]